MGTTWAKNQADPAQRTATLDVTSVADGSRAPMDTDLTGLLQIRIGSSWALAAGSLVTTGYDGFWRYEATQDETNNDTNEVELRITGGIWFAQTFIRILGVSSGNGLLLSYTPEGEITRWIPIVLTISVPAGYSVVIIAELQDAAENPAVLTHVAYSDELGGFQSMWDDKSTVTVDLDAGTATFSVLPNGGWTRPTVTIVPYVAYECEIVSDSGPGAGSLISYTTQGAIAPSPEVARKTPIIVKYQTPANMSLIAIALMGNNTYFPVVMYADELDGLQTLFDPPTDLPNVPASIINSTGSYGSGRNITASWLPIGGWIREAVQILSYIAFEATP